MVGPYDLLHRIQPLRPLLSGAALRHSVLADHDRLAVVRGPVQERIDRGRERYVAAVGIGVRADPVHFLVARVIRGRAAVGEALAGRTPDPGRVVHPGRSEDGPDVVPGRDVVGAGMHLAMQVRPVHFPAPLEVDRFVQRLDLLSARADPGVVGTRDDLLGVRPGPGDEQGQAVAQEGPVADGGEGRLPLQVGVDDAQLPAQLLLQGVDRVDLVGLGEDVRARPTRRSKPPWPAGSVPRMD